MAYGPFNTDGNSVSKNDLATLIDDIIKGVVKSPLATANNENICDLNGDIILMYSKFGVAHL